LFFLYIFFLPDLSWAVKMFREYTCEMHPLERHKCSVSVPLPAGNIKKHSTGTSYLHGCGYLRTIFQKSQILRFFRAHFCPPASDLLSVPGFGGIPPLKLARDKKSVQSVGTIASNFSFANGREPGAEMISKLGQKQAGIPVIRAALQY
jgi:hypothetical protein